MNGGWLGGWGVSGWVGGWAWVGGYQGGGRGECGGFWGSKCTPCSSLQNSFEGEKQCAEREKEEEEKGGTWETFASFRSVVGFRLHKSSSTATVEWSHAVRGGMSSFIKMEVGDDEDEDDASENGDADETEGDKCRCACVYS